MCMTFIYNKLKLSYYDYFYVYFFYFFGVNVILVIANIQLLWYEINIKNEIVNYSFEFQVIS